MNCKLLHSTSQYYWCIFRIFTPFSRSLVLSSTYLHTYLFLVRFQVLRATNMKMIFFWDVAPCSLVDIDRRFTGAYCLHHQGDQGESP
jgi:hypothetical protein